MRLKFLVAAAALALFGAPSAASAYQLCARSAMLPQQLSEIAGSVQVGSLTYNITFKTGIIVAGSIAVIMAIVFDGVLLVAGKLLAPWQRKQALA